MWVFIKGIASECSARDLSKLVKRHAKLGWSLFSPKVIDIERSKVLKIMYCASTHWEYHGLVYITHPDLVHGLIGRLNAARVQGKHLHAHPYVRRHSSRDRRRLILDQSTTFPGERRKSDRRRGSLVSQIVDSIS
ncbi:MAG: hypothetical protein P8179_05505 [Candidatus Thiodiazotropha sp.]|jgi:hypothetical protein